MSEPFSPDLFGSEAEQACALAIEKVGGLTAVAKAFNARGIRITPQAIDQWRIVPAPHARLLSELAGGEPNVYRLRPDVFGPEPAKATA